MEMEDEPLSLGTFDPAHALQPYLNTPRSLEACRRNGVNPVELVEIPFDEFRKDFPNDADAAQRRYERIDGSRRGLLKKVLKEWDDICASGWVPTINGKPDTVEAIINVAPDAHSSLLEMQAAKFRKIEQDQWDAMQRMIQLELRSAVQEAENKKLVAKHAEIQAKNDDDKKAMQAHRDELFMKQVMRKKQQDEERAAETRALQELETRQAIEAQDRKKQKLLDEKRARERREAERRRREDYTKEMKDNILKEYDQRIDAKVSEQLRKDKERNKRLKEYNQMVHAEKRRKNKIQEDRMAIAQKGLNDQRTIKVDEARKRVEDEEAERRKKLNDEAEEKKKNGNATMAVVQDKLNAIRNSKLKVEQDKIEATRQHLQLKDAVFQQEMNKLKAQQDRRKQIKMIRQEAYELSNRRRKKADDYKAARLQAEIKRKDDIYAAQKAGGETLSHMRHLMSEIMQKTKNELRSEIHNLSHKDELNPDNVVKKVLEVSSSVMFRHLGAKFTIDAGPKTFDDGTKSGFSMSNDSKEQRATTAPQSSLGLTGDDIAGSKKKRPKSRSHSREPTTPLPLRVLEPSIVATNVASTKTRVLEGPSDKEIAEHESRLASQKLLRSQNSQTKMIESTQRKMEKQFYDSETQALAHYGKTPTKLPSTSSPKKSNNSPVNNKGINNSSSNQYDEGIDFSQSASLAAESTEVRLTRPISKAGSSPNNKFSGTDVLPVFDDDDDAMSGSGGGGQIFTRESNNNVLASGDMAPSMAAVFEETGMPIPKDANGKGPDGRKVKPKPDEFRREYSFDHPLAGGTGKYKKEKSLGKKPVGGAALKAVRAKQDEPIEKLTMSIAKTDMRLPPSAASGKNLRSNLEKLRKDQNEILLKVLEEERKSEEDRARASRSVPDVDERNRLELVFAEERRRASERIIQLTREHEQNLKDVVVGLK